MGNGKPLKVRGVSSPGRVGLVASNLQEALHKGCHKLQLPMQGTTICLESDGTLFDEDYYQTLDSHTCVVLVCKGQTWPGGFEVVKSNIEAVRAQLQKCNLEIPIRKFLDEDPTETHRLLVEFVSSQRGNIDAESRDEDPDWFQDVEQRFKTKSRVMFVKAQERIRGYFSKTKEMLNSEKNYTKNAIDQRTKVFQELKDGLTKNRFHGVYFARRSDHIDRLCDPDGWFRCEGAYDVEMCTGGHLINPYSTKDSMVLFSTWNLDHVIEKSRSVIPGLNEAIRDCPQCKDVDTEYFYSHLFTRKNLKLVDIRCHKKGKHTGQVQKKYFYKKPTKVC